MTRNEAFKRAERKINEALRTRVDEIDFSCTDGSEESEKLTELPQSLGQLTQLRSLKIRNNALSALPECVRHLTDLRSLNVYNNRLNALPEWIDQLTKLETLDLSINPLESLPECLERLANLKRLELAYCNFKSTVPSVVFRLRELRFLSLQGLELRTLPGEIGELNQLETLVITGNGLDDLPSQIGKLENIQDLYLWDNKFSRLPEVVCGLSSVGYLNLDENRLTDLPGSLAGLEHLTRLDLEDNPLNPDLAAAFKEGLDSVKRYLRAKTEGQIVLNEAKLILTGEGEVGKSSLLGALRGDLWKEDRPTTHGIEIKPFRVADPGGGRAIVLNGWDFGGQRVYRPTHQFFFSAPAVYLVVWKPREGPQQGMVKEWIKLVKHREPEAKILVVATHGGPTDRQPDIDRQEIWDIFGKETVVDFLHVDCRPPDLDSSTGIRSGECKGIGELKEAIARVAASLPEMGRSVSKRWHEARLALAKSGEAYLLLDRVFEICEQHGVGREDARVLLRICRRVGDLINYENDPALHDIVVLKPDWLAAAISFVLDDKQTRDGHGLVSFARLGELWNDAARDEGFRYDSRLHPLFLRLMERFDVSYKVAMPADPTEGIGFWQRMGSVFRKSGDIADGMPKIRYTSLIAQLVPDVRPEQDLERVWPATLADGDEQQAQICKIVDSRNRQSAEAEGLFYQLIVRLHRFSLGRADYKESVHWQRGLVLDDEYNGRAFLEYIGNDVRITVRAPYPEKFLSVLTRDVEWLVENFWEGLRCDVMVPCIEPCGRGVPGTGLFEVEKLIESKRRKRPEYPCPVCNEWQDINSLLRNAPAARPDPVKELLGSFGSIMNEVRALRPLLVEQQGEVMRRFDTNEARILSRVDDAFAGLMRTLVDEAKDGPRLFSFEPVDRAAFNPKGWVKTTFRITLWCEHAKVPLPLLNKEDPRRGVYEFDISREWFVKAAPFLQVLCATLSVVLPVAASATKLAMSEKAYKAVERQLDFGKECAEAMLKTGEKTGEWMAEKEGPELGRASAQGGSIRAQGSELRQLQAWLKEKDPGFGGLVRVQNRQQEFLWVHPRFRSDY